MSAAAAIERVSFEGGVMEAIKQGGKGWLAVKPACAELGVDAQAQQRRLDRSAWATTAIMAVVAADGRTRDVLSLDIACVAMWLATIETSRIRNEAARKRLEMWQCQAADVLDRWFRGGAEPQPAASAQAMPGMSDMLMSAFIDELRAGREERKVTLGLVLKLADRLLTPPVQPPSQVPRPPSMTPAAIRMRRHRERKAAGQQTPESAKVEPPVSTPEPSPAPVTQPKPEKEEYLSLRKLAAHLEMTPAGFRGYIASNPGLRQHQRSDGRWPRKMMTEIVAAHRQRVAQAVAAAAEPSRMSQLRLPIRSEEREAIVRYVRTYCAAFDMNRQQAGETWVKIYDHFAELSGYDPRQHKEKGQRAIDVVEQRGHLELLGDAVHDVCPASKMMAQTQQNQVQH